MTSLHTNILSNVLEIQVEGPSLSAFSPDRAVKLWWEDCKTTSRVNQAPRKEYRPRSSSAESTSEQSLCWSDMSSDQVEKIMISTVLAQLLTFIYT